MSKDLGEGLENIESELESLKTKDFRLFGIKMNAVSISAALTLVASLIGSLYGGFILYKDYMDMKEVVQNIDIEEIKAENTLVLTKLDDAIEYTRDIKKDLKDDIIRIEQINDSTSKRVKEVQMDIDSRLRELSDISRETEKDVRDTMRDTETRLEEDMRRLEKDLNEKILEALDNPLNDMK